MATHWTALGLSCHVQPSWRTRAAAGTERSATALPRQLGSSSPHAKLKFFHSSRIGRALQPCRAAQSDAEGLARKYAPTQLQESARLAERQSQSSGNALFALIMVNLCVYVLDHVLKQGWVPLLYLNHQAPRVWQWITCAFCHGSWQHLSSNLFGLYVFGKELEADGGSLGVVMTYLVTALGASIASYFFLPRASLSLGASGAVFGFYATSVLLKLSRGISLKAAVEGLILGQFVFTQVQQEFVKQASVMSGGGMVDVSGVSHVAHLAGAAAGVLLIAALSRLPGGRE